MGIAGQMGLLVGALSLLLSPLLHAVPEYPQEIYRIKNAQGFFCTAEAFYLSAREDGLRLALLQPTPTLEATSPDDRAVVQQMEPGWHFGYRLGVGYSLPQEGWDILWHWTRCEQQTHQFLMSDLDQSALFVTSLSPRAGGVLANGARGLWDLHYETMDLDLGCRFWMKQSFAFRPYVGIKVAWIDQRFEVEYDEVRKPHAPLGFTGSALCLNRCDCKGIGPLAGAQMRWAMSRWWSVYGDASASLLWSEFYVAAKQVLEMQALPNPLLDVAQSTRAVKAMAHLALGVQWDRYVLRSRYHLDVHLGWEQFFWCNQNLMLQFLSNAQVPMRTTSHGDLALSGLVMGARLDF